MQATIVENYTWLANSGVVGLQFETDDGVPYPGLISIDLKASDAEINIELDRYFSGYVTATKQADGTYVTTVGPWASADSFCGFIPAKRNDKGVYPTTDAALATTTIGEPMTRDAARQAIADVLQVFDGM